MVASKRICIYPKDIMRITGKGEKYSRTLIQKIRKKYKKEDHQFISIEEFCLFTSLDIEQVNRLIID